MKTIEYDRLLQIVEILRSENGCPWDRAQTHATLKKPLVEEACEVVCGVNLFEKTKNADNLKEELGDLLFQIVLQAQLAQEEGLFTMEDVCRGIADKMERRHPHVFGDEDCPSGSEISVRWEELKKKEHKADGEAERSYLFEAFEESKQLIDAAAERKQKQNENVGKQ